MLGFVTTTVGREAGANEHNDCCVRAFSIVLSAPYEKVREIFRLAGRKDRHRTKAASWVPLANRIGKQILTHPIRVRNLVTICAQGRFLVLTRRHMFAVIDGVVHDLYAPSPRGQVFHVWRIS